MYFNLLFFGADFHASLRFVSEYGTKTVSKQNQKSVSTKRTGVLSVFCFNYKFLTLRILLPERLNINTTDRFHQTDALPELTLGSYRFLPGPRKQNRNSPRDTSFEIICKLSANCFQFLETRLVFCFCFVRLAENHLFYIGINFMEFGSYIPFMNELLINL